MIPAVVELFGLVIVSFLNAVIHRVTLRMRDVTLVQGQGGVPRGR
jgi:hypothetical protein